MNQKVIPCFWFDKNGEEAFSWYASLFDEATHTVHNPFLVSATIGGLEIWSINGGPVYRPNPTISLYTTFQSKSELERIYQALVQDAKVMMPLDKYDWSELYAWIEDRYGISWQLIYEPSHQSSQRILPCLMYTNDVFGNAEQDMKSYVELYSDSDILFSDHYKDEVNGGKLVHGRCELDGVKLIFMDAAGKHDFTFTEGCSLVRLCEDQNDIDKYWNAITSMGEEGRCGWCKDRSGLSWQIIPSRLGEWMADPDAAPKVGKELQAMNKINMAKLWKI